MKRNQHDRLSEHMLTMLLKNARNFQENLMDLLLPFINIKRIILVSFPWYFSVIRQIKNRRFSKIIENVKIHWPMQVSYGLRGKQQLNILYFVRRQLNLPVLESLNSQVV